MPKHAKRTHNKASNDTSNTNPLAKARGKKSAEDVWDAKTGVGYILFVEYYKNQPMGTVCGGGCLDSKVTIQKTTIADLDTQNGQCHQIQQQQQQSKISMEQGKGQSRAAKRRKKKKCIEASSFFGKCSDVPKAVTGDENIACVENKIPERRYPFIHETLISAALGIDPRLQAFFHTLAMPLPLTFRIRRTADPALLESFQSALQSLMNNQIKTNNETVSNPSISIRPVFVLLDSNNVQTDSSNNNISVYQSSCSKDFLRSNAGLKELLLQNSQNGVLARQEFGSMLPVAALTQVGCWHNASATRCLDLCASPGSKTLQALEMLFATATAAVTKDNNKVKPTLLVANDISQNRLEALQQAVARSGLPESMTRHLLYTCQDAAKFELRAAVTRTRIKRDTAPLPILQFHVILCDVPCSGDGTCRKDRHILPTWKPAIGNQLHGTQVAILSRAVELLEPGGYVCYSTCSLNPIENEAVVAAVLQKYNKRQQPNGVPFVELVHVPNLPEIILHDGISTWKVAHYRNEDSQSVQKRDNDDDDDNNNRLESEDESALLHCYATHEQAQTKGGDQIWSSSLWPPPNVESLHLSRCKRLWPQDHDSGGFFFALLRKRNTYLDDGRSEVKGVL